VYNANDEFGQFAIELSDDVIADIQVITVRDFQTVICAAIQIYCGDASGREVSAYLNNNLFDLRDKKPQEKKDMLEDISKHAPRVAYAEARIFRPLQSVDKRPTLNPKS
jgi:hypothetical protein